jgi:hypothetical protein
MLTGPGGTREPYFEKDKGKVNLIEIKDLTKK